MIKVYSTKSWYNLACAHCQWFDKEEDGSPGECASLHGYDRSVHITFAGTPDRNGWIVPFGGLRQVKDFLEYYLDHTALFPADDLRIDRLSAEVFRPGGILANARVLPFGVSMEMTSLFIYDQVNPYIHSLTDGRCYITKVEVKEHERNSGFVEIANPGKPSYFDTILKKQEYWSYEFPRNVLEYYNEE